MGKGHLENLTRGNTVKASIAMLVKSARQGSFEAFISANLVPNVSNRLVITGHNDITRIK